MPFSAQNLVSVLPLGVVPTITGLRAIDVAFTPEGTQVIVNGFAGQNDSTQGTFVFNGANTGLDDKSLVISTPTTGRWVRVSPVFSGLSVGASYSGIGETFTVLSGSAAGAGATIYTFAPSYLSAPKPIVIKMIGTGSIRVQATGNDVLWDLNSSVVASSITVQTSGIALQFQPVYNAATNSGVYYRLT